MYAFTRCKYDALQVKARDMPIKYTYGTVLTLPVRDDSLVIRQRTVLYGTAGIRTSTYSVGVWEHNDNMI